MVNRLNTESNGSFVWILFGAQTKFMQRFSMYKCCVQIKGYTVQPDLRAPELEELLFFLKQSSFNIKIEKTNPLKVKRNMAL